MEKDTLIIVLGKPASGKTTVAKKLGEALKIPYFGIDTFKEIIFNDVGWNDLAWSQKVREASMDILDKLVASEVSKDRSLIIEGSFSIEQDKPDFERLVERYQFKVVEVLCEADGKLLFQRFKERAEEGHRHPGHRDLQNLGKYKEGIEHVEAKPLGLGPVIRLDTNDMDAIDYQQLIGRIEKA